MKQEILNKIRKAETLPLLEQGEVFLDLKEFDGLSLKEIVENTVIKQATVYNGVKLAYLPDHIKSYIRNGDIPATTVLTLSRGLGKKSPTYHKELLELVKEEIKSLNKRKESGEYGKRVTLREKMEQLKNILNKNKTEKSKYLLTVIELIDSHDNMKEIKEEIL